MEVFSNFTEMFDMTEPILETNPYRYNYLARSVLFEKVYKPVLGDLVMLRIVSCSENKFWYIPYIGREVFAQCITTNNNDKFNYEMCISVDTSTQTSKIKDIKANSVFNDFLNINKDKYKEKYIRDFIKQITIDNAAEDFYNIGYCFYKKDCQILKVYADE